MANNLLIKGGSVIDGTGAPAFEADVRVRDGIITEVAANLAADGEQVIDASGAYVSPGFIEAHTHLDGALWWDTSLSPMPEQGVTTAVAGNCGNSIAPLPKDARASVVDLLSYLEDIPQIALTENVPWTWESWPEYQQQLSQQKTSLNIESFIGHIALRIYVMGDDAWEREATDEEIQRMAEVLDEALGKGAIGFSSNIYDIDRRLKDVPPKKASDKEFSALFAVLGKYPKATFQIITGFLRPETHIADVERMVRLCAPYKIRTQWGVVNTETVNMGQQRLDMSMAEREFHKRIKAEGHDFWANFIYTPLIAFFNFETTLIFDAVPAWHNLLNSKTADKMKTLADPEWRAMARDDWDNNKAGEHVVTRRPHHMILHSSETGIGPVGINLKDYAEQTDMHVSDALAEWICLNGIGSTIKKDPSLLDEELVIELFKDPQTVGCINDSGAHLQLFCGAGQTMALFTHYVRELGALTVEEAVHVTTGKITDFYGMNDRGIIEPGRIADINIFELDKLKLQPEIQVRDTPGGSWRFTREAAGFRATFVRGELTCDDGRYTGATPGTSLAGLGEPVASVA